MAVLKSTGAISSRGLSMTRPSDSDSMRTALLTPHLSIGVEAVELKITTKHDWLRRLTSACWKLKQASLRAADIFMGFW